MISAALMVYGFPLAFLILVLLVVSLKTFFWAYLWQLKEYRADRMADFLSTTSGRRATTNIWTVVEFIFAIFFGVRLLIFLPKQFSAWEEVVLLAFLSLAIVRLVRIRRFPQWTMKALALTVLSLGLTLGSSMMLGRLLHPVFAAVVGIILVPVNVSLLVALLAPLSTAAKQRVIDRARLRVRNFHPTVVGITGSFGKSSTKEFLRTLLAVKYRVFATPKNVNADIGIANILLRDLLPTHEVAVIEMGAYREGEIARICRMIPPVMGILTGINDQHLSLFRSSEAIARTKAELLRALPPSGVAIVNRDIPACRAVAEKIDARTLFFSMEEPAHAYASHITVMPSKLDFTLHIGSQAHHMTTGFAGKQIIPGILAAGLAASELGVPFHVIVKNIPKLRLPVGTMQRSRGFRGSTIIDDHYNANPDGFLAALDYLAVWEGYRKIIVTSGMIELGKQSDFHHRRVGARIGEVADLLIICNDDFEKPLRESAKHAGLAESNIVMNPRVSDIIAILGEAVTSRDVILVEGGKQSRMTRAVLEFLKPS